MRKRLTVVISGPSGVGKGTICEKLREEMGDKLGVSISYTTRDPRPRKNGTMEEHGVEYFFIDEDEFQSRVQRNDFMEYAGVHGKRYGTSRSFVQAMQQEGKDVILEIDMQGALQVKADDPQAVLIYILPPDFETLKARLLGRGSETPEQAEKRLKDAKTQLGYAYAYDFVVVNDDLDTAVAQVKGIIAACTHRANNCKLLIDSINHAF